MIIIINLKNELNYPNMIRIGAVQKLRRQARGRGLPNIYGNTLPATKNIVKTRLWNTFVDDKVVFQNRVFPVVGLHQDRVISFI